MKLDFDSIAPLRQILEAAHNGVVIVDHQGRIMIYNRAARNIAGWRTEEVLGKHFEQVSPQAWADMRKILANGKSQQGIKVGLKNHS